MRDYIDVEVKDKHGRKISNKKEDEKRWKRSE